MEPGGAHHGSPDKEPARRLATLRAMAARRCRPPPGSWWGSGETAEELAGSLFVLAALAAETGPSRR